MISFVTLSLVLFIISPLTSRSTDGEIYKIGHVHDPNDNNNNKHNNLIDFEKLQFSSLNAFQKHLRCDSFEPAIIKWWRRLLSYNIVSSAFYSTACYISEYDNIAQGSEIPLRWSENLFHCWSSNITQLPAPHKNPVFLVQIIDSKVYLGWPGAKLRYSELRLSQRTQHSLLLIDFILNYIPIKAATFLLSSRDTPIVPRFTPVVALGQGATTLHIELAMPQYQEVVRRARYYPHPPLSTHTHSHTHSSAQEESEEGFRAAFLAKRPRLVWAGSMQPFQTRYPDLIDVFPSNCDAVFGYPNLTPVVPFVTYGPKTRFSGPNLTRHLCANNSVPISLVEQAKSYQFHIALPGNGASGRMLSQIALECGVLLLPSDHYLSIYSEKLIPWTHFVPVDADLFDLEEKLRWLIAHPNDASQLAFNLRHFSRNYGRLEDWLCYTALALDRVSNLTGHIPLFQDSVPRGVVYERSLRRIRSRRRRLPQYFAAPHDSGRFQLGICVDKDKHKQQQQQQRSVDCV